MMKMKNNNVIFFWWFGMIVKFCFLLCACSQNTSLRFFFFFLFIALKLFYFVFFFSCVRENIKENKGKRSMRALKRITFYVCFVVVFILFMKSFFIYWIKKSWNEREREGLSKTQQKESRFVCLLWFSHEYFRIPCLL